MSEKGLKTARNSKLLLETNYLREAAIFVQYFKQKLGKKHPEIEKKGNKLMVWDKLMCFIFISSPPPTGGGGVFWKIITPGALSNVNDLSAVRNVT